MKNHNKKLRIGVIFGGRSGEHEVSLMSANSVLAALDRDKYEVIQIGIDKDGRWISGNVMAALREGKKASRAALLPDPQSRGLVEMEDADAQPTASASVTDLDVVIPILHGTYGEDGTVQGLLELADLPYVGAGVVGSAVGMDKAVFKYVMAANGIPILPWQLVMAQEWGQQRMKQSILQRIETALSYPMFTKPANLGSSVGISKCENRDELEAGLDEAAKFDRRIVIEQGIDPRELEVAVLGNAEPIASVVGEIQPRRTFYDYVAKYMAPTGSEDASELLIPADLDAETSDKVRELAIQAYKAIDCAGMGRVDLLMDRGNGRLYLNEINTLPGFTHISMYPKLWQASGMSYSDLLDKLITLALERYAEKDSLQRVFEVETK